MDNALCRKIEPGASLTRDRIEILKEAGNRGIRTWVFLGPFMPFLSDTDDNVDALFESLAELKLERIYADRLNPRSGVWQSIKSFLSENHPQLIGRYGKIIYNDQEREAYGNGLKELVILKAKKYGLADKVLIVF
jgi:DNA repair photolyase